MTPTLDQIREGIRNVLSDIEGLHVSKYWPGNLQYPAAFPMLKRQTYGVDMTGNDELLMDVIILAAPGALTEYEKGQELLDHYLSVGDAKSIVDVIDADPTLGGVVGDTRVVDADQVSMKWDGNGISPAWGAALHLRIWP